mgnify:CR=1 FL=1
MVIKMTEVRLGQIANIFTGKCNAQDAVEDGIYPLFDRSGEVKKSDKYFADCEAIIVPGESTTFIPRYYKGKFNLHQRAYCINPHEDVNGVFLYYLIKANSPYFFSVATGATVASLRLNNFLKMKLNLPLRQAQDKIANILSTYDKLIENNDKRIAILEQEAEELYKEWFVRFRFPGHEKLKFVDGLPFEWSYARFKDIATIIRGVSYSSDEIDVPEGNYLVNLKNIRSYGGYNFNEEKTYIGSYKGTQTLTKLDLIMGVTDMTQDRRCVGSVALCPEFDKPAIISADLIKILSKYSNVFLYCHLKFGNYSKYISEFANGANVLHLRPKYLENIKILMPSKDLIEKFSSICIPIFNNILNLVNQNNNLQNQRDYLLPRLMSGKLEVK